MARYGSEKIRGHGIPEAIEAILLGRSRLDLKVAILKPLSSAISIGTGGPFGAEGPIIMTGGAIGSLIAQMLPVSDNERKTLLVAGAAAGMTTVFGTPIAAIMLAVELLLFEWTPRSFIPVAVAAIVAAVERHLRCICPRRCSRSTAAWTSSLIGLLCWVLIGMLCGPAVGRADADGLCLRGRVPEAADPLDVVADAGRRGRRHRRPDRAAGARRRLRQHRADAAWRHAAGAALLLLVVKAVIWAVALGSGTSGGVLAPLLIMGGGMGPRWPHVLPGGQPRASGRCWRCAATMGGTMRAPLTATFFAVELTGNTHVLLPLIAACVTAHLVTVLLMRRSILTEKVARRGHHLVREYRVDPFALTRVREVMATEVQTLPETMTLHQAAAFLTAPETAHPSFPVVDERPAGAGDRRPADDPGLAARRASTARPRWGSAGSSRTRCRISR